MGSDLTVTRAGGLFLHSDPRPLLGFLTQEAEEMNIPKDAISAKAQLILKRETPFFAAVGGVIVGLSSLSGGTSFGSEHTASLRIHVGTNWRGKGLGTALIEEALTWADDGRYERITATPYMGPVWRDKLLFFGKHGFAQEGVMRQAAKLLNGTFVDVALLARVR